MTITAPPRGYEEEQAPAYGSVPPDEIEHWEPEYGDEVEVGAPPGRVETLIVFLAFAIAFGAIGYQVVTQQHVVVFDALDRLTRAYLVWHNDPPKLASIGFLFPPLSTMVLLPLALIKPLATSLIALPVMTAVFMAGTLVLLNRALARCEMSLLLRLVVIVAFALNPLIVFYAGNGMSEAVYLFFLAWALYCFMAWYQTTHPRFLIGAGIAISLLVLTRYGFVWWALVMAGLVGAALARRYRVRDEIEGSVIAFGAPIIYGLVLWTLFNLIIVGDPLNWITGPTQNLAVNATGGPGGGAFGFDDLAGRLLELLVGVSPLTLLVLPALLFIFVTQRDDLALWLATFVALGIVVIGATVLIEDNEGLLRLRDATPTMLTAVFGAAWVFRRFGPLRIAVWIVTVVVLLITLPITWNAMKDYPFQNQEQAFVRAVGTGKDQEGMKSIGGFRVGIDQEAQVAAFIKRRVKRKDAILTDNAQTFGVILLNGRPQLFLDRADRGDAVWRGVLRSPFGRVRYLLVAREAAGDLIRRTYRQAAQGKDPALNPVFINRRYALLRVPASNPGRGAQRRPVGPGGRPGGVSPTAPGITREAGTGAAGTP